MLYVTLFCCEVIVSDEQLREELVGEGTLAHTRIPHYHQLIGKQVVIWVSGHGRNPRPPYCANGGCSLKATQTASHKISATAVLSPAIKRTTCYKILHQA
jgi:hypothetical protein